MIKATELRIGNLILIDEINELAIDGIGEDEVHLLLGGYIELQRIEGIPLTEEWLIKFGFDKEWEYWWKNDFHIDVSPEGFINSTGNLIPYVHLLQNAYFFDQLDGSELTIKTLTI